MGLPGGTALTGLSECGPGFNPPFREALLLSSKAAGGTVVKNSLANAGDTGDMGLIPGSGRSPGGGNGNPLQYPCLGNPVNRGAWRATVHSPWGHKELDMTERTCTQGYRLAVPPVQALVSREVVRGT